MDEMTGTKQNPYASGGDIVSISCRLNIPLVVMGVMAAAMACSTALGQRADYSFERAQPVPRNADAHTVTYFDTLALAESQNTEGLPWARVAILMVTVSLASLCALSLYTRYASSPARKESYGKPISGAGASSK